MNISIHELQYTKIAQYEKQIKTLEHELLGYVSSVINGAGHSKATYHAVGFDDGKYIMTIDVPEPEGGNIARVGEVSPSDSRDA